VKKMRKIIVLLLVIGFLVGTYAVIGELEEYSFQEHTEFSGGEGFEEGLGGSAPCGGEGDGGPPTPG
jgi:hypothetical protein